MQPGLYTFWRVCMSGHNKWSSIKHKKGAADAKRGKIFTKIIKEITVAAKIGGGDPAANPRLRAAIERARAVNMPGDTMERGIKKGTGELEGVHYEEMVYEGYGPEGVAIILDIMTDNKNRTAAEIRQILSKKGGSLGSSNCVGWMFEKKGIINIAADASDEDSLMELVLEAGAEDVSVEGEGFEVVTPPDAFSDVMAALEKVEIKTENAEVTRVQTSGEPIRIDDPDKAQKVMDLLEDLDDHDEVSGLATNFDFSSIQ